MKRSLAILFSLFAFASVISLAGCGGSSTPPPPISVQMSTAASGAGREPKRTGHCHRDQRSDQSGLRLGALVRWRQLRDNYCAHGEWSASYIYRSSRTSFDRGNHHCEAHRSDEFRYGDGHGFSSTDGCDDLTNRGGESRHSVQPATRGKRRSRRNHLGAKWRHILTRYSGSQPNRNDYRHAHRNQRFVQFQSSCD